MRWHGSAVRAGRPDARGAVRRPRGAGRPGVRGGAEVRPAGRVAGADLDEVRMRLEVGLVPARLDGLPGRARRAVALAAATGAPAVPALDAALAALGDRARRDRALAVATAQARAVATGLVMLPLLALPALQALLDAPLLAFYATPAGVVVGAVAVGLLAAGGAVAWRLVARAATTAPPARPRAAAAGVVGAGVAWAVAGPVAGVAGGLLVAGWWRRRGRAGVVPVPDADEVADLLATALGSGLPAGAALRAVAGVLPDRAALLRRAAVAVERGTPPDLPAGFDRAGRLLARSTALGAPAVPALRRLACDLRADELARALAAAERLPALLTFPTTVLLLPASLLLVGAPLVAAGLAAVGG